MEMTEARIRNLGEQIVYLQTPIAKIIEAVVTNNVGFEPDRERVFEAGTTWNQEFLDGRVITDFNDLNLHWHLRKLADSHVLIMENERDRRLPLWSRFEFVFLSKS